MTGGDLDFRDRGGLFDGVEGRSFDLIVIGGGVTGAGVARDAAMRGLSVVLVEARDFASGTSSRSSKMIHGGLRYMAQGDLALVAEAASERKAVERVAPHLTRQTPFVIPAKNAAVTAKLRTGMWAFEKLGGVPKDRRHEVWSKAQLTDREPTLEAGDLSGAVVYPEYLTDDARLTLANIRSAVAHGARVLSYAAVASILMQDGVACGVVVDDTLAGVAGRARILGRVIINAAGPWVDAVRGLEAPGAGGRLKLSKGVHLVVRSARLPVERTIIMPDADYWPTITDADVDYLLAAAALRFTVSPLTRADVVSAWSGVRPLVAQEGKSASEISRKDEIWTGPGGVLSIAGGKLTAYRMMAERIVDLAQETLGLKVTPARTGEEPLVGGDVAVAPANLAWGERLVGLYGAEAQAIFEAGGGVAVEARHAVLKEGALTLEDYWVRRSARAWFDLDGGLAALVPAAQAMAPLLGWSAQETQDQITACQTLQAANLSALETA